MRAFPLREDGLVGGLPTYKSNSANPPNHRYRRSQYLTSAQAVDLVEAAVHAQRIGRPLNYFITINFACARMTRRAQEIIGHYLRLIGQWLAKRGVPNTFLWVLEHACESDAHPFDTGEHVHILLHCPAELARKFSPKVRSHWLAVVGGTPRRRAFKANRFALSSRDDSLDAEEYHSDLKRILRYFLKTVDPSEPCFLESFLPKRLRRSTAELFKVKAKLHLPIEGRRCSRSENISKGARERWLRRSLQCPGGEHF